jgi:tetratricopeptide (TPR) repeat protein
MAPPALAQDAGSTETAMYGKGVAITVVVHDPSGDPISSAAIVKVLRGGTMPAGQAQTSRGQAELVVNSIGEFTLVVEAAGYPRTEKQLLVNANGRLQVDVYLSRNTNGGDAPPPGRPLLAPKAKKALDEASQALSADNLSEADQHVNEAVRLAPGNPDVLYVEGVLLLKQRRWGKAQEVLEKATQLNPAHAQALAALGMALCDQGKYDVAIAPLEKSVRLNSSSAWDARWALARAYYQQARYDEALQMSGAALEASRGKAPEIQLLVAQSLTAVGRYEDAAHVLRDFLQGHADRREAATARRWLDRLASSGKISSR